MRRRRHLMEWAVGLAVVLFTFAILFGGLALYVVASDNYDSSRDAAAARR